LLFVRSRRCSAQSEWWSESSLSVWRGCTTPDCTQRRPKYR